MFKFKNGKYFEADFIQLFYHPCHVLLHHAEREFHVSEQIQQVAIQYWVIAQTLVIFQTNLKGTAQLQLLQLLWPLGDVIFYAE